jgi:hypothetical protein
MSSVRAFRRWLSASSFWQTWFGGARERYYRRPRRRLLDLE